MLIIVILLVCVALYIPITYFRHAATHSIGHEIRARNSTMCEGSDDQMSCQVDDLVYENQTFKHRGQTTVPRDLLCSAVNNPPGYRSYCRFETVIRLPKAHNCTLEYAVALGRLNPNNPYHVVFEDIIPFFSIVIKSLLRFPTASFPNKWGLIIVDGNGPNRLDTLFWKGLLPEIRIIERDESCYIKHLFAGLNVSCIHWGHCLRNEREPSYDPPNSALLFRNFVMSRLNLTEVTLDVKVKLDKPARVTIVQRSGGTRHIRNVNDVIILVTDIFGTVPAVVDMSRYSVQDQIKISHNSDIIIMVHGGALVHILWLPPGALIIDIYPYGFAVQVHSGLIHSIRKSIEHVEILHEPFDVSVADQQVLTSGSLQDGCYVPSHQQGPIFWKTAAVHIDTKRFREHLVRAHRVWRTHAYVQPMTRSSFDQYMMHRHDPWYMHRNFSDCYVPRR